MINLSAIVTFIREIGVWLSESAWLLGIIIPVIVWIKKLSDGMKCQLRSEMLRIYYHNREKGIIRQYEYENFIFLYNAYKALKGNSFIDKIYEEVHEWEVVT